MEYVTLNNGVRMPMLGYGVFQIPNGKTCEQAVLDAISVGYRLIDTAQSYGNEQAVGNAVHKCRVPRSNLFITSKVWISNAGYEKAKASIRRSMELLQVDYLDLMLIHQPMSDYYGTYQAMEDLYRQGVLRAIGVSNFYPDRLADLTIFSEVIPAVNQVETNPFHQQIKAYETMKKFNIQQEAWASFAQGRKDMFHHPLLQRIANRHHKSVAQVILRWLTQRSIVALAKTTHLERMKENIDIFDFQLSEEELCSLAELDRKESSFFDHYDPEAIERLANMVRKT